MPTEQELEKTYSLMGTDDLLAMMVRREDYTGLAIDVATRELEKRQITPEEIKALPQTEDPYKLLWIENCLVDLGVFQKAAFYFLWLPMLIIYRITIRFNYQPWWESFKTKGYILKGQQASYYRIMGFSFFLISIIVCGATNAPNYQLTLLMYWILGFGLVFLFDIGYNRQRLTNKLNDYKEAGELPWGA
jgi:hypothetical protein